jgi:predicted nucleic acid-binding protein
MLKLMLDTNVFNNIVKNNLSIDLFKKHEVFGTHVQLDEINRTKDEVIRLQLSSLFLTLTDTKIATSSLIWDVSRWDESSWSDGIKFNQMHQRLVELDKNKAVNSKTPNQIGDVLIAETAINNDLVLVTNDANLTQLTREFGGTSVSTSNLP